jgi:hypothetical protein
MGAGTVEVVTGCIAGRERSVRTGLRSGGITQLNYFAVRGPWRVVGRVLEEAMVDVERAAVDDAQDLPLAMQVLGPDARRSTPRLQSAAVSELFSIISPTSRSTDAVDAGDAPSWSTEGSTKRPGADAALGCRSSRIFTPPAPGEEIDCATACGSASQQQSAQQQTLIALVRVGASAPIVGDSLKLGWKGTTAWMSLAAARRGLSFHVTEIGHVFLQRGPVPLLR